MRVNRALGEVAVGAAVPLGGVDYRMARDSVIRDLRNGRVSRVEVCDAHPELARAARSIGEPTGRECPVCAVSNVVLVSYAFGPHLPRGGRCVESRAEVTRLARRAGEVSCYVVEVCPECSWNYLARTYSVGRRR